MILPALFAAIFAFNSYVCDTSSVQSGERIRCREWSKKTRKPISSWTWLNGKPDGVCEEWHGNGRLRLRHKYRSGLMVDTSVEYFSSGKLDGKYLCDSIGNLCKWEFTHETGGISRQGQSVRGKPVGTIKTYHPSGMQETLENYDHKSIRDGAHASWSSKGILRDSVHYSKGRIFFSLRRDTISKNDICRWRWSYANNLQSLVEAECFDSRGVSSGKVSAGNGVITYIGSDGKATGKETYADGILIKEERFLGQ